MSRPMIAEDEMVRGQRFWEKEDEVHTENKLKTHQSCRNCRLVKWYPPLLSLSMVMAGIFCWLYVTKPMTVTRTVIAPQGDQQALLVAADGVSGNKGDLILGQEKAVPSPMLNPEIGALPGETAFNATQQPGEVIPGQEITPLRIERKTKSLFQPIPSEQLDKKLVKPNMNNTVKAAYGQEAGSEVEVVHNEFSEESVEPRAEEEREEVREIFPSETRLIEEIEQGGSTYKVAISLMGELVSDFELGSEAIASSSKSE